MPLLWLAYFWVLRVFIPATFYHYLFNWFKDVFTYFLFSKYCIQVFFTGKFSVLCLAVRLPWMFMFVMLWAITGAVRLSWLMLFVVLGWAIAGVLGCSVVLAYAVCGAWLGLAVRLSWVVQFVGLGWAMRRGRAITGVLLLYVGGI